MFSGNLNFYQFDDDDDKKESNIEYYYNTATLCVWCLGLKLFLGDGHTLKYTDSPISHDSTLELEAVNQ